MASEQRGADAWTLDGFSDDLIVSHSENNCGSAVRALNAVRDRLTALDMYEYAYQRQFGANAIACIDIVMRPR